MRRRRSRSMQHLTVSTPGVDAQLARPARASTQLPPRLPCMLARTDPQLGRRQPSGCSHTSPAAPAEARYAIPHGSVLLLQLLWAHAACISIMMRCRARLGCCAAGEQRGAPHLTSVQCSVRVVHMLRAACMHGHRSHGIYTSHALAPQASSAARSRPSCRKTRSGRARCLPSPARTRLQRLRCSCSHARVCKPLSSTRLYATGCLVRPVHACMYTRGFIRGDRKSVV